MKRNIIVLGGGLVGSVIARDLSQRHHITVAEISPERRNFLETFGLKTVHFDANEAGVIPDLIRNYDLVVGALPGHLGFHAAKEILETGKNLVDISFFPEDVFQLDEIAKRNNCVAVFDCGVAPGMGNIILGYHHRNEKVLKYSCLVGGLPVIRQWPWEYRAVFSPADVIEEYTRPARFVQNSQLVVREALSDTENIYFEGIGTLESWNSDGLRTLIDTMPDIPDMIEKTLRYPGCVEYLKVLRETGFFSKDTIEVNGQRIRPLDVTSALLFPQWKLQPGEEDYTVMRIEIEVEYDGRRSTHTYNLLDRYDRKEGIISMARTTGYTCNAVAELLLDGTYNKIGVSPPEFVGQSDNCFDRVIQYLQNRNVNYHCQTQTH